MNVALLADTAWLDEELTWFQHLTVGLCEERVRVIQVTPQDLAREASSLLGEHVAWTESRWANVNRWRLAGLQEDLQRAEADVIHALGDRVWRGAARLAGELGIPVVFACNAAPRVDLERLTRDLDPARVAFAASTQPLADELRQRLGPAATVALTPPGVHAEPTPPGCDNAPTPDDGDPAALCTIVSGNGLHDGDYLALLQGLADLCRHHPQAQFFLDGSGSDQHQIWKAASKLGLLQNVSLIPRRLGHRELLLRADLFLQPQALGRSRSITLQAMAHGLTVLAHDDPTLDYLLDDQTAWVLRDPQPADWAAALARALEQPDAAHALGDRARAWVTHHRGVSSQVARVLQLYRGLTGQTLAFTADPDPAAPPA